jgi:hypothetical protein
MSRKRKRRSSVVEIGTVRTVKIYTVNRKDGYRCSASTGKKEASGRSVTSLAWRKPA